ncbi:MAG: hypothetical protein ACYTAF_04160 [Planctomycetota bacterium]|jgi:hypothetical protein
MSRLGILFLVSTLTASCVSMDPALGRGRPVTEVSGDAALREIRLHDRPSPLRARRGIPVLAPPEVFAVYIPTHVDRQRDLMVGEHWVFFKLRDAEWFVEREAEPAPVSSGSVTESDLGRLRRIPESQWERVLIPHDDQRKNK